ncbi:hypothetical protein V3C99_012767 [Haemonchus contortus]
MLFKHKQFYRMSIDAFEVGSSEDRSLQASNPFEGCRPFHSHPHKPSIVVITFLSGRIGRRRLLHVFHGPSDDLMFRCCHFDDVECL